MGSYRALTIFKFEGDVSRTADTLYDHILSSNRLFPGNNHSLVYCLFVYCMGGIMISVLILSVVDRGFEPRSCQIKDYKLVFVASPLSMQH